MKEYKGVISILGYFLLGILLISVILPILDGLTGLILTMSEVAKGYFSLKVGSMNKKLRTMAEGEPETKTRLIGFCREPEEDYEEEEYEDD